MAENAKKLGLFALVGLIVGSSIGGGIFNAATDVAGGSAAGPGIIAWIVVSVGIYFLVLSMNNIVAEKPQLDGIVHYAEAGFGKFWGFVSGWGYWLSAWLGNIAYAALLVTTVGNLIPALATTPAPDGSGYFYFQTANILPTVVVSILFWLVTYLVARGVESAAFINSVVMVAKLVPLAVVFIATIVAFNAGMFGSDFWTNVMANASGGGASFMDQMKSCFMVMIWCFIGIEGASIFSERAKTKSEAAKATAIGFFSLVALYVLLSILPYGVMTQKELAGLGEPALAFVLEKIVGPWGATLVNLGLVLSLLGAFLAWTLLPVQTLQQMTNLKYLPPKFNKQNEHGVPVFSLVLTTLCCQVFILTFMFPNLTIKGMTYYGFGFTLCSSAVLITWLFGCLYQAKLGIEM
jgi:arginine:ornithine antiporter/lysine permease